MLGLRRRWFGVLAVKRRRIGVLVLERKNKLEEASKGTFQPNLLDKWKTWD